MELGLVTEVGLGYATKGFGFLNHIKETLDDKVFSQIQGRLYDYSAFLFVATNYKLDWADLSESVDGFEVVYVEIGINPEANLGCELRRCEFDRDFLTWLQALGCLDRGTDD